jgi:hypothetical protein
MSFRVPQAAEPKLYNSRFAEIAFHELGHASHYRQVGQLWWVNVGRGEIPDRTVSGNPYGDGNFTNAGHVALTESWAEFIGMNYQLRRYPTNVAFNTCTRSRNYYDGLSGTFKSITYRYHYPSTQLIENQMFFYGGGDWIPMGLYHDLMDNTNISPNNSDEKWDGIQGVTIKQMYDAFGPEVTSPCAYYNSFTSQNPTLNQNLVFQIFDQHKAACY